ncbi:MAG: signal peptide peptidase SppA [Chitinophagaceae bacterium]
MRNFFKIFFASLLALFVFVLIGIFLLAGLIGTVSSSKEVETGTKAVLFIDLKETFPEQTQQNPVAGFSSGDVYDYTGLYDLIRMIRHAKADSAVKGIYLKCDDNGNGFATSEELRNALLDFRQSKKFIYAYGDVISQRAYYVANVATKIYCNPIGSLDWRGYSFQSIFFKQALENLEIDPQVIYAGKFKSATEPLREEKMTEPNRLQSFELVSYLYNRLLIKTQEVRGVDTATLHAYANNLSVNTANDAVKYKLIDGVKYDDEVREEIKQRLGLKKDAKINMVPVGKYAMAVNFRKGKGKDRIALIYAQGDIVDGKGEKGQIGGETFKDLIRKARLDKEVKAVVFRVNSGGGSVIASEEMWRELSVTRKEKPVVISFGDVAASGGYYLACNADSIFAQPSTITGSIGVFTLVPNMQSFFKNRLGVTFDGVKTAEHADAMSVVKPLNAVERNYLQRMVDTIYQTFLTRVANGRKLPVAVVDSMGQGRVWMGEKALQLKLVDKLGNLQDAVDCAARMAKITDYRLKEYPEPQNIFDLIFGNYKKMTKAEAIREELGDEGFKIYHSIRRIKQLMGSIQARIPFEFSVE